MTDFTLKYDGTGNELIGEDPNGNQIPVPFDAVETDKSLTVSEGEATDTLHYGSNQDRANAGGFSVAIGIDARANGDDGSGGAIGNHVAVGYQAGQDNTGTDATMVGRVAGGSNTGTNPTIVGAFAGENNTGANPTIVGRVAGQDNTGADATIVGAFAGENNTGDDTTVLGEQAARGDGLSDPATMGDDNIGIGKSAIRNNQASGLIAIGQQAGINAQTDDQLIITDRNGTRRMVMDLTNGNLSIDGSLTENATL